MRLPAIATAGHLTLAGCTAGVAEDPAAGVIEVDPTQVGFHYLDAIHTAPADAGFEAVAGMLSEDSPAQLHGRAMMQLIELAAPVPGKPATLQPTGPPSRRGDAVEYGGTTWADFELDAGGRLERFTVGGHALASLQAGPGEPVGIGASSSVGLAYAFASPGGDGIQVMLRLRAGDVELRPFVESARYETPDGELREPVLTLGSGGSLEPGESATVVVILPSGELGGTLVVAGLLDNDPTRPWEVEVPVTPTA